jgi:hypothetical protein
MHGVDAARAVMLAAIGPLAAEDIALDDALGRTLAAPGRGGVRRRRHGRVHALDAALARCGDAPLARGVRRL